MNIKEQLESFIIESYNHKASDIHFHPISSEVKVSLRIKNNFISNNTINIEHYSKILRFVKFRCNLDPNTTNKIMDGSFTLNIKNEKIFIRMSTVPLIKSESLVLRIIYEDNNMEKNLSNSSITNLSKIYNHMCNNTGIYIFTGPTGSGKTTAMYYLLNKYVKNQKKKVITIENPVEIVNDNFTQIQVNEDLNIDYNDGLRSALRQDPDIIMIGEIRDEKTARNVFRAGLTGHSVFTTMHTKDKYGVIERFIDFGFHKSEIISVISGISNQRLVNKNGELDAIFDISLGKEITQLIEDNKIVI